MPPVAQNGRSLNRPTNHSTCVDSGCESQIWYVVTKASRTVVTTLIVDSTPTGVIIHTRARVICTTQPSYQYARLCILLMTWSLRFIGNVFSIFRGFPTTLLYPPVWLQWLLPDGCSYSPPVHRGLCCGYGELSQMISDFRSRAESPYNF